MITGAGECFFFFATLFFLIRLDFVESGQKKYSEIKEKV